MKCLSKRTGLRKGGQREARLGKYMKIYFSSTIMS